MVIYYFECQQILPKMSEAVFAYKKKFFFKEIHVINENHTV